MPKLEVCVNRMEYKSHVFVVEADSEDDVDMDTEALKEQLLDHDWNDDAIEHTKHEIDYVVQEDGRVRGV